jgi:hypothetical protein
VFSRQRLIVLLAVLAPRAWMDRLPGRLAAPVKFKLLHATAARYVPGDAVRRRL